MSDESPLCAPKRTSADHSKWFYAFTPWSWAQRKAIASRNARPVIKLAAGSVYSDPPVLAGTRVIRAPSALSR
jgi:hypothetical protein